MREVKRCVCAQGSRVMGVDPETIDHHCPALVAAPHVPQNPQVPPGTRSERFCSSASALSKSMSPPAFL